MFVSKAMGLWRDILIASRFGAGAELDAYNITIVITQVALPSIITVVLGATFIPVYKQVLNREEKTVTKSYAATIFFLVLLLAIILTAITAVTPSFWLRIFAPGFEGERLYIAYRLIPIASLFVLLFCVLTFLTLLCQGNDRFKTPALAALVLNPALILGIYIGAPAIGVHSLVIASLIAYAIQIIILITVAKKWLAFPRFTPRVTSHVLNTLRLGKWAFVGLLASEITGIILFAAASLLPDGHLSAFQYGNNLLLMIKSITVAPLMAVMFSKFSDSAAGNDYPALSRQLLLTLMTFIGLLLPLSLFLSVYAEPAIRLLFERNMFDAYATSLSASGFSVLALALVPSAVSLSLVRLLHALRRVKITVFLGLFSAAVQITAVFLMTSRFGVRGLAIASFAGSITAIPFMLIYLRNKITIKKKHVKELIKIIVACAVAICAGLFVRVHIYDLHALWLLSIGFLVFILIYTGMLFVLRSVFVLYMYNTARKVINNRFFGRGGHND